MHLFVFVNETLQVSKCYKWCSWDLFHYGDIFFLYFALKKMIISIIFFLSCTIYFSTSDPHLSSFVLHSGAHPVLSTTVRQNSPTSQETKQSCFNLLSSVLLVLFDALVWVCFLSLSHHGDVKSIKKKPMGLFTITPEKEICSMMCLLPHRISAVSL